jgi:hypothetical protein
MRVVGWSPTLRDEATASRSKTIFGGSIGHFIECYEWSIYGLLAGVFAAQMFPVERSARLAHCKLLGLRDRLRGLPHRRHRALSHGRQVRPSHDALRDYSNGRSEQPHHRPLPHSRVDRHSWTHHHGPGSAPPGLLTRGRIPDRRHLPERTCLLLFTYPLLSMLAGNNSFGTFLFVAVVGPLFIALNNSVIGTVFAEFFPTSVHVSGIAIPVRRLRRDIRWDGAPARDLAPRARRSPLHLDLCGSNLRRHARDAPFPEARNTWMAARLSGQSVATTRENKPKQG